MNNMKARSTPQRYSRGADHPAPQNVPTVTHAARALRPPTIANVMAMSRARKSYGALMVTFGLAAGPRGWNRLLQVSGKAVHGRSWILPASLATSTA